MVDLCLFLCVLDEVRRVTMPVTLLGGSSVLAVSLWLSVHAALLRSRLLCTAQRYYLLAAISQPVISNQLTLVHRSFGSVLRIACVARMKSSSQRAKLQLELTQSVRLIVQRPPFVFNLNVCSAWQHAFIDYSCPVVNSMLLDRFV